MFRAAWRPIYSNSIYSHVERLWRSKHDSFDLLICSLLYSTRYCTKLKVIKISGRPSACDSNDCFISGCLISETKALLTMSLCKAHTKFLCPDWWWNIDRHIWAEMTLVVYSSRAPHAQSFESSDLLTSRVFPSSFAVDVSVENMPRQYPLFWTCRTYFGFLTLALYGFLIFL